MNEIAAAAAVEIDREFKIGRRHELGLVDFAGPRAALDHATLTETLRVIDARALAGVLGARYLEVSRRNENVPYFSTICPDSI
jgi:hypothetical protein